MTNSKTTKRALFSSVVALLLCFTMLLGTTFAWFTDSAASGSNVITAGNLDIVVEYTLDGTNWNDLDGATDLFQKGLWEPGHTEVVALRIKNNGTLALKYAANMNIVDETVGKTKDGADIVLSDILTVSTLVQQAVDADGNANQIGDITLGLAFNGENSVSYENTATFKAGNVLRNDVELHPGAAHYLIVKVDMAETVGNEANHNGTNIPTINFGINVLATQFTYENDSFDNQYDKDAEYPEDPVIYDYKVKTLDDLKEAFANGGNILLNADLDITETLDVPAGKEVLLNLNGKTISMRDGQNVNTVPALFKVKMGDTADGPVGKLIIEGDGTVDVGNNGAAAIFPGGDVIINGGTFIRDLTGIDLDDAYPLISGYNQNKYPNNNLGTLVINGGYFDGGFYNTEADKLFNGFVETHEAGQGQSSDTNAIRLAVKDNMTALINESNFKAGEGFVVTGGTFVGANPAWGDEGCMLPSNYNGNYLRPWSYYQGGFIPGQVFNENNIVLPAGYSITEGVTADGIPTYTVNYSK